MNNRDLHTENMAAFAVTHIAQPSAMQGEKVSYRHCEKTGREEQNCFEIIRYPLGWIHRAGRGGRGRSRGGRGGGRTRAGRGQGQEAANRA